MSEPQLTILHVDDNEANRYVVARILQNAGFTVLEAATGDAGLKAIAAYQPALVILDVQLPDFNGFEVCRQIKSNPETAFLPVLHLSASFVQSQDKAEGLDSGADGYLAQPVEPIELLATVRSLLRIRRAEELALASARDWQMTFDSINDGVCLVDREGKLLRCNQAMMRLFCKPSHEILGCAHHELMHAELGVGDGTCFRLAKETHQRQVLEIQAQGRWFAKTMDPVLDEQGRFTGAVFILADITARKQTEAALRESQELKQRILESSKDCIKVLTLNSEIAYISEGGLCLLEIEDPTTILNARWLDFWQGEDYENAKTAIAVAKAGNTGQFQGYLLTQKGTLKWWDSIITPVRNASGQVTQLVVISRDITKQKQAAAEREQLLTREQAAREQAETANRIKDEFLAVLSHELRSPLNPILGWAKLLQSREFDSVSLKKALATIERNASLQSQLIEDLLDISGILQGKINLNMMTINLVSVIEAAMETVRLAAEAKEIQIQTMLDPTSGRVLGDPARLQQIVWNLLTNAVKFTPQGGQVKVRLERAGSSAQITVNDTGKGISATFLPHIFGYFRQADTTTTRQFGGLGLGLAIVHHLVELHGGTVQAESLGEGKGTTFTVKIPLIKPNKLTKDATTVAESTVASIDSVLTGIKILVVDDDADSRDFYQFVLQQFGAIVTAAASANQALQALALTKPDILLSDIGMPDMDGYMLIREVRAWEAKQGKMETPIQAIALTAYAGEINQQQALAAGFQQHISKPVPPEKLIDVVIDLIEQ